MKKFKNIISLVMILSFCLCMVAFSTPIEIDNELGFADNRIIVVLDNKESMKFNTYTSEYFSEIGCKSVVELTSSMKAEAKANAETQANTNSISASSNESFNNILCLELNNSGEIAVNKAIKALQGKSGVLYVGPDYEITQASTSVNDTYYSEQWGHTKISLPQAWDYGKYASNVVVGVIDSGIDYDHLDIKGNLYNDLCHDFSDNHDVQEFNPTANTSHGTLVAGIIGAVGNNSMGISGVCWRVKLVSLKVFDTSGNGYSSFLIKAIDYADSMNIPILNFSGEWSNTDNSYFYYDEATYYAISNYSGLFICAAGNDNLDLDNTSYNVYPAMNTATNMIVVGASTTGNRRYTYTYNGATKGSNYGIKSVDVFAPGVDILSTYPDEICLSGNHPNDRTTHKDAGYHYASGTSFATPYVTGVAALLLAQHPSLTTSQLKNAILNNVDTIYDSSGDSVFGLMCTSGGRLNAYKALKFFNHTHSFTYEDYGSLDYHICECNDDECGNVVYKEHRWQSYTVGVRGYDSPTGIPMKRCRDCGATKPAAL